MKIAYHHLLRFLKEKPSIENISDKLFQLGHEHEIEKNIFDIEFTPNRGDCLSLYGISRDLNIFYKTDLDLDIYDKNINPLELNFVNQSKDKCPEISFLNIEVVGDISDYKDYLQAYFDDFKLNKNNFFADVSNYLAYEMGQPTHCYDFSLIEDDITLKENTGSAEFSTLLGNTINLKGQNLVFTSKEEIINLSGVIGGMSTACTQYSKNILIECAYFKPEAIIGKALKYNINSDASHKFERGTDPMCHEKVLRRFIKIVQDHVEIIKLELYTNQNNTFNKVVLDYDLEKVNNILGLKVTDEEYTSFLIKLGFNIDKNIKVPSYRSDISHQNDLAEELARSIGYNNIPSSSINLERASKDLNFSNQQKIKSFFVDNGFFEIINSPFCSENTSLSIKVDNPLDSNREYIRINLIDSLLENLIYNEKRQQDSIKLFEVSDIYNSSSDIYEKRLAIIVSGRRGHNYLDFNKTLDDKYLIEIFEKININIKKYILNIDRNNLDSKIKTPVYAIEIKIDDLYKSFDNYIPIKKPIAKIVKYEPISGFPSSSRDLSFSIKDSSSIKELVNELSRSDIRYLKKSFMFDFYENHKTNEIKIGYRFIFQSNNKTLKDNDINQSIDKLIDSALSINSVYLPGNS